MSDLIDLSLFYVITDRRDADAPEVKNTATILYGEGQRVSQARPMRRINLGDGLHVLQMVDNEQTVLGRVTGPFWDYNLQRDGSKRLRFLMDLVQRPPILGLSNTATDRTASPGFSVGRLEQYVCNDKRALLTHALTAMPKQAKPRQWLGELLQRVGRFVGKDFSDEHAHLLGDVLILSEVCSARAHVSWKPFAQNGGDKDPADGIRICIEPSRIDGEEIHINARIFGTDSAPIHDELCVWKRGQSEVITVSCNQPIGGAHLRAWVARRLVWEERYSLNLEMELSLSMMGGQVYLQDKLSDYVARAHRGGTAQAKTVAAARKVQHSSGERRSISGAKRSAWRANELEAKHQIFDLVRPRGAEQFHYPRGGEGRAQAVLRIAQEISSCVRAWLIDPFFDEEGAAALLPRIKDQNTQLTIYTSLPNNDDGANQLRAYLGRARAILLPPNLTIHRITTSGKDQPFHDRFLILERPEQRPIGYILSNSLSGAAKQYPLVMTELPPAAVGAVLDDIDELFDEAQTQKELRTERLWPIESLGVRPMAREKHTSWFPGWPLYLAKCLPNRGPWTATWIRKGISAGLFVLDGEENPRWYQPRKKALELLDKLLPQTRNNSRFSRKCETNHHGRGGLAGARIQVSLRLASVLVIGELTARNVDIKPSDVAARLSHYDCQTIATYLRASFDLPDDVDGLHEGLPRHVVGIRQLMASAKVDLRSVTAGLGMWSDTHTAMDLIRGNWGRRFCYEVLAHIAPELAVGVGDTLRDPCFLTAILQPFASERSWPTGLGEALLRSKSSFLRALGTQSIATPTTGRRNFEACPIPPDDIADALAQLEGAGVSARELAYCVVVWGTTRGRPVPPNYPELATAFVERAHSLSKDELAGEIGKAIVHGPDEFLRSVIQTATTHNVGPAEDLLEALIDIFGGQLITAAGDEADNLFFHQAHNYQPTANIALATIDLARRRGTTPRSVLEQACRRADLIDASKRITPFRRRPGGRRARRALLWSILWELCAARLAAGHPSQAEWISQAVKLAIEHKDGVNDVLAAELIGAIEGEIATLAP